MARILVLDDEAELLDVIVEELTEEGHSTIGHSSGQDALDYLAKQQVDLIISDITMPKMSGYQFFRSLREQFPEHAQTPFIFMTALADRDSELKGLRLGVDDYIKKPIDFDLMLMRVETHLRRRQAMAGPALHPTMPAGDQAADSNAYRSDAGSSAKLKTMLQDSGGQIMASRFVTISLEEIRDRIGDRWSEMSERLLQNTELVIRAHMAPDDILSVTPSHDFIVFFAKIEEDEIASKTSLIRDAIWERLFAETDDEDLSSVDARSHELMLDPATVSEDDFFLEADKALNHQNDQDVETKRRELEKIYSFEELFAYPLLGPTGGPSKIKALSFNRKVSERARAFLGHDLYDAEHFLGLQKKMFERLKEKPNLKKAFATHAMLLPLEFGLLRDAETRDELTSLCKDLETSMSLNLIIEVVGTPDRLKANASMLTPLPVGRHPQFIELRRPQQAEGVALNQLGVAYVAMSFGGLKACHPKVHASFMKEMTGQGVKLYVKDVPEGKLFEAQNFQGKLFSMQK